MGGHVAMSATDMSLCPLLAQSGHEPLRIAAVQTDPEPHFADHKSLLYI
jgi:hypothetical protein